MLFCLFYVKCVNKLSVFVLFLNCFLFVFDCVYLFLLYVFVLCCFMWVCLILCVARSNVFIRFQVCLLHWLCYTYIYIYIYIYIYTCIMHLIPNLLRFNIKFVTFITFALCLTSISLISRFQFCQHQLFSV